MQHPEIKVYWVSANDGGTVFVKDNEYFVNQGGLMHEWGKSWKPVRAVSIEHAREIGCGILQQAKAYAQHAAYMGHLPSDDLTQQVRDKCGIVTGYQHGQITAPVDSALATPDINSATRDISTEDLVAALVERGLEVMTKKREAQIRADEREVCVRLIEEQQAKHRAGMAKACCPRHHNDHALMVDVCGQNITAIRLRSNGHEE